MITLKSGNYTIYDPSLDGYEVTDFILEQTIGSPGRMEFTVFYNHPNIAHLNKMSDIITLFEDNTVIFRGRIVRDSKNFDLSRKIEVEGLGACLNDSAIPPFRYPADFLDDPGYIAAFTSGNVVQYLLQWLLAQHNAQVGTNQQILLGNVTVVDNNNYIGRVSEDFTNTWETICEKLPESVLGGFLNFRYEGTGIYLDYIANYAGTNVQRISFGENLLDLMSDVDGTELYTAVLPVGSDGLTIADLPDGTISSTAVKSGNIVYNPVSEQTYGRIVKIVGWDDVTVDTNLRTKAINELAKAGLAQTITVKACDLRDIDGETARLKIGNRTRIYSTPHGMNVYMLTSQIKRNIINPGDTEISFGETTISQSDINVRVLRNQN